MKIKNLVLAVAMLGVVGTTAHANETKPQVGEPRTQVKMKCPGIAMVMPIPAEHRVKATGCKHKHHKHTAGEQDQNYNGKIKAETEIKNKPVVHGVVPPEANKIAPPLPKTNTKIIPLDEYKVTKTDTSVTAIDMAQKQYDLFYSHASDRLRNIYNPARYGQYALPTDIATIKVGRVKSGILSNFDIFGKKDKLSIYLFGYKPAMRLYGLYEQRMIAWHNGKAPSGVTVERAINHEAKHLFLDMPLVSNETTVDMMKYLDARLSSKDSDIVRAWLIKHQDHAEKATVLEIIAKGVAQQKTDSLYLR